MADRILFTNNAKTTLDGALAAATLVIPVADGSVFSSPGVGEYELATIYVPGDESQAPEIVKITSRSTNDLTVVRSQEGTSAPTTWASGVTIGGLITKGILDQTAQGIDNTGDARGANALDLQTNRSTGAKVASGAGATAVGNDNLASGAGSLAMGKGAKARFADIVNIAGVMTLRNADGGHGGDEVRAYSTSEVYISSDEIDFKQTAADNVVSITLPTGISMFVDECGIITTNINAASPPDISFGNTGDTQAYVLTIAVGAAQSFEKETFLSIDPLSQVELTMSIKVASIGATFRGRVFFKGVIVEDE